MPKKSTKQTGPQQDAPLVPARSLQDSRVEQVTDLFASAVGVGIPYLGPILQGVISGTLTARRFERVQEAIHELSRDLSSQGEKVDQEYLKTEEFEELLAQTLDKIARELDGEKRAMYRTFILRIMTGSAQTYSHQRIFLRLTEELSPKHVRLLRAHAIPPSSSDRLSGSRSQGFAEGLQEEVGTVNRWTADLERAGLIGIPDTMTGLLSNAADAKTHLAPLGSEFLRFIAG